MPTFYVEDHPDRDKVEVEAEKPTAEKSAEKPTAEAKVVATPKKQAPAKAAAKVTTKAEKKA